MTKFEFAPSQWVPFRDLPEIQRCRAIPRSEIERHPSPDFRIQVVKDADLPFLWVADMLQRILAARDAGKPCVMLLPNPAPIYRHVARLINTLRLDCRHVWMFALDEYADEQGRTAPEDWPFGFQYAMLNYFYAAIDPALRPPRRQIFAPTNDVLEHYFDLMQDAGGVDISYTGPGWTGHLGFVEPDAPEFDAPLAEWKTMGARICTLSPFTLAQNSLHGSFGKSGDLAAVPPRAATVGPKEIIAARHRLEVAGISVHGTTTAWQRLIARLCYHGPVTPKLPSSIHQELRTDCYLTETIAADIAVDWDKEY